MKKLKSVLAMLLVFAMVFALLPATFAAERTLPAKPARTEKTEKVELTEKASWDPSFDLINQNHYSDDDIVKAIVILDDAPVADVAERGSVKAASYRVKVINGQNTVLKEMSDIKYDLNCRYDTLLNGFCCDVAFGDLDAIAAIDGVAEVHIANQYDLPVMDKVPATKMPSANAMTGNDGMWGLGVHGEGTVIAVLDTGLLTTHEAFQDVGSICADSAALTEEDLVKVETPGQYISAKVPFAYDYADHDDDVTDQMGHGTHVSGICAGWVGEINEEEGSVTAKFSGAAPAAQILSMKIFSDDEPGTNSAIYFQALEDAYKMGADVVNMSIGAQNGFTYDTELENRVFGNVYKRLADAGVILSIAGGNEFNMAKNSAMGYIGPEYMDYGTIGTPACYEGCNSVASFENNTVMSYAITVGSTSLPYVDSAESAEDKWLDNFGGKTLDFVVVKTADGKDIAIGAEEDYKNVDVTDKIAVVSRGESTFEEKVELAAKAGAIGCIVVNNQPGQMGMSIETYEVPAVCMNIDARPVFLSAEVSQLSVGEKLQTVKNPLAGAMSDFSNWGTSPMLTIDPAITGIGGQVYSSVNTGDDAYEVYSGTSMATPNLTGIFALVTNIVNELYPEMPKADRAKLVIDAIESSAMILSDDIGIFSVRQQGAGLASALYATEALVGSAYIEDPLKELGDDPEKTGVYEYDVTLKNLNDADVVYSDIETYVLTDAIGNLAPEGEDPVIGNALRQLLFGEEDCTVTYSVGDQEVTEVTVPGGSEVTVHVKIAVSDAAKEYLDLCENGTYVEGYTEFYRVDPETEKVVSAAHATFLSFYGDWTQAPVLEQADFQDFLDTSYLLYTVLGEDYADKISPLQLLPCYTMPNLAFGTDMNGELATVFGQNLLGEVPYDPARLALATDATDASFAYANTVTIIPYLLRNARHVIMTAYDKVTGEVYAVDDTQYLPKAVFDEEGKSWQSYGTFVWDGTNQAGEYLPDGTKVTVTFDTEVPYEEKDPLVSHADRIDKDVWGFDVTIDNTAPVVTAEYDEETDKVNITASDEQYLMGILIADSEGSIIEKIPSELKNPGEEMTLSLDAADYRQYGDLMIGALDYATNQTIEEVPTYVQDVDATVTLVSPFGTDVFETVTGETFEFPGSEYDYADYVFDSWYGAEVDKMTMEEYMDAVSYYEGDEILVTGDMTFYALYPEITMTEGANYYHDNTEVAGDLALIGFPFDMEEMTTDVYKPIAMGADGEMVDISAIEDAVINSADLRFFTEAEGFRFTAEENEGSYSFKNVSSGKYIAAVDGALAMVDELTPAAQWTAELSGEGNDDYLVYNVENPNLLLTFIDDPTLLAQVPGNIEMGFNLIDDSVAVTEHPIFGAIYAHDLFSLFTYKYAEEGPILDCFTTSPKHVHTLEKTEAKEATCTEDGNIEYWFCSDCGMVFSDAEGKNAIALEDTVVPAPGHELVKTEAKEATDTENGNIEYWTCSVCGKIFADAEGENEIKFTDTIVLAKDVKIAFDDCPEDAWYMDSVEYVAKMNLMGGVGEGLFGPDESLTRAMMVTVLYRAAGSPEVKEPCTFKDVEKDQWFSDAIAWAEDKGIVNGVDGEGHFAPENKVTREDIATILWRASGKEEAEADLEEFKDVDKIMDYAKDAMTWAVSKGILNGDNGNLKPLDFATRAEFAAMFTRYDNL